MSDQSSSYLFIVNPKAGTNREDPVDAIADSLNSSVTYEVRVTTRVGHATDLAEKGVQDGYDVIVAVGGDGTLNEVGRALEGADVPMGIVPAGSGNALARALGVPLDWRAACGVLLNGQERRIDTGHLGDQIFLSTAGTALDAEICWRFNNHKGQRGLVSYITHSISGILSYRATQVSLQLDDDSDAVVVRPTLLTFANTPAFGYDVTIAPGAEPDDGLLDVCVVENMTLLRAATNVHRLFSGGFDETPGVSRYRAKRIRVERERPGYIQVDGEAKEGDATLEASVREGGLSVIAPA